MARDKNGKCLKIKIIDDRTYATGLKQGSRTTMKEAIEKRKGVIKKMNTNSKRRQDVTKKKKSSVTENGKIKSL